MYDSQPKLATYLFGDIVMRQSRDRLGAAMRPRPLVNLLSHTYQFGQTLPSLDSADQCQVRCNVPGRHRQSTTLHELHRRRLAAEACRWQRHMLLMTAMPLRHERATALV